MIIVTGASKGLGYEICNRLISLKKDVFGISRDTSSLPFPSQDCDVSSYSELKEVSKTLKKEKIRVTGLINAAGIASMNLALTTPKRTTENIINTNLLGTIYSCQNFSPLILRNRSGSIINFSTLAVPLGLKGESVYVASKSGVEGFSRSFAREMSDFNIRVNCIAPGPINTDLIKGVNTKQIDKIISDQIIKKQFKKSDVCDLVEFLIDDKSKSLSGQILNIGGV